MELVRTIPMEDSFLSEITNRFSSLCIHPVWVSCRVDIVVSLQLHFKFAKMVDESFWLLAPGETKTSILDAESPVLIPGGMELILNTGLSLNKSCEVDRLGEKKSLRTPFPSCLQTPRFHQHISCSMPAFPKFV